ncbi:MAG: glycosyltransferase family 2 protein [Bacteroidia bacterium]
MKVSGFTFIRNAIKYDYPIVEAIRSILPICDEVVVAVGASDDDTLSLIESIDPDKVKIVQTTWDDSLREGGSVLAIETDKAFAHISKDADWAFYIQGDEVIPEQSLDVIFSKMKTYKDTDDVDGLLFRYLHFYGSYDYVGTSSNWYHHEIRVVKNDSAIYSYKDAQGFRKGDNEKLSVVPIEAWVYHYGWVKEPKAMQEKQKSFNKFWHDDAWMEKHIADVEAYDYSEGMQTLKRFHGKHPAVMQERIARKNWNFDSDLSFSKMSFKDRVKSFFREKIGIELGYKNYRIKRF